MADNTYPLGPCPQCCRGACTCGPNFWAGTACEGLRVDTACVKEFCGEILFDYTQLPGGGLSPRDPGRFQAFCDNPAAVLPTRMTFPLWCWYDRSGTGTAAVRRYFTSAPISPCYPNYFTFNPGREPPNKHGFCFNLAFDAGAMPTTQGLSVQIPVELGVWLVGWNNWGQNPPEEMGRLFKVIQCDPLIIEADLGNPGWNNQYNPGMSCDEFKQTWIPSDQYLEIPFSYPGGHYIWNLTPCSLTGLFLNEYNCGAAGGGGVYPRVPMKIRITERTGPCEYGFEYNAKVAHWWCTPAGCVQSVDQPADSTAGPFNSRNECMAGCGTAVALKWYCTPSGCVKVETPPANATSGPHDTLEICQAACQPEPPTPDPFWCVSGTCVQSASQPAGSTGPFSTMADCAAGCSPPLTAKWWCIYGVLVKMDDGSSPHPDAHGPYDDAVSANCGPAEMVWHCGETGPARTSRWEAVQRGWQYWNTEQETIDAGCVLHWYCVPEGCGQFTSPPAGVISGPHATEVDCQAACSGGPTAGWYCVGTSSSESVRGVVSYSCQYFDSYPPMGTIIVSGPHENSQICGWNCAGGGVPQPPPIEESIRFAQIQRVTLPCIHLGANIEDPATCGCGTAVLRQCAVHGQCRKTGYPKNGEAICLTCPDYQAPESSPQVNLG